jgi:CheY-like chemotaxis protein
LLVADDDGGIRSPSATLLGEVTGVAGVIQAKDGVEAVELGREQRLQVAVLDLNMPRLDGIAAAFRLGALQPSLRIALQSSDPELLRERAAGLELPLFDKLEFDRLLDWVGRQAAGSSRDDIGGARATPLAHKIDLCCSLCGYGIVSRNPPERCPMCGCGADWADPPGWTSRRAALHERAAG